MKTKISLCKEEGMNFPVIMHASDEDGYCVVLFTDETSGMVLYSTDPGNEVGEYNDSFTECSNKEVWSEYDGILTIEN